MVLRPHLRRVQDLRAQGDSGLVEGLDRGPVGRGEGEVALAGAGVRRLGDGADPELGAFLAVADSSLVLDAAVCAEGGQDGVVERGARPYVFGLDLYVVQHGSSNFVWVIEMR
ncbi:hypothetical protein TPA0906_11980 [Streptomyces olivaceus]|nr:hypothetical protein TPA0906_11980 [Streptomyces olivaceus]